MAPFATYLARLDTLAPMTPIDTSAPSVTHDLPSVPVSLTSTSPAKRPRSDSPDTSPSSSSPPSDLAGYFNTIHAAPHSSTTSSNCFLRSILTSLSPSLDSSPNTSPPASRPLSRRSSTSCKSVRFARCTNASVFPALSGDVYDRSPIIPTCQSESLALPKRKRDEAEGWIKCVERERLAAAKRKAAGEAPLPPSTACGPWSSPLASVSTVEGVHGLVEGGYFVGEERDSRRESDEEQDEEEDDDAAVGDDEVDYRGDNDDPMAVDDDEDESEEPQLVQDDSGDDSDDPFSVGSAEVVLNTSSSIDVALVQSPNFASVVVKETQSLGFGFMSRSVSVAPEEEDEDARAAEEERIEKERLAAVAAQAASKQKCRDRYGICALGKYTRAEVFQSYDSLGGF
ncbi:hypothetical protein P7C70_g2104, partial [Phenoliferia sp. Uapishka_3]